MEPVKYYELTTTQKKVVRDAYIAEQSNQCYHCKEPLALTPPNHIMKLKINWKLFPNNFQRYPVHLQHNHKTGMTEGAVHARCNAVLWQYHGR